MTFIKKTPQQINDITQQESNRKAALQNATNSFQVDSKIIDQNIPSTLKPQGQDKLALVINKKRSEIKKTLIPLLVDIAVETGIKNIGTPNIQIPDTCLSQEEINKIINKRNQIVNKLNQIVKIIDSFTKVIAGVGLITSVVVTLTTTLKTIRKTASLAVKFIPSPPGAPGVVVSTLNDLKDLEEINDEKINKYTSALASSSLSLSLINNAILNIIKLLNGIDLYLNKCSNNSNLTPLSDSLLILEKINNEIQQSDNEESYNGFTLEIIEIPFSPTVNKRKAVAKNSQGIILLETPSSFTTENQILLNSIKLLIDSNNLKAD